MKSLKTIIGLFIITLLTCTAVFSQSNTDDLAIKTKTMKTYVIERDIPEAGNFTPDELKGISQKSCSVLDQMGSENIQWLHSYVTENKIYCIYKAQNKELLREHAEKGGFPATYITEVSTMISPVTAN
jgi:hypothetical protein